MAFRLNSTNVVSDTIDGEALAIRSDTGAYYSMRGPSATAWVAIISGVSLDDAARAVADHHGGDATTVRADLQTFADLLVAELLVVPATSVELEVELPADTRGLAWEEPALEKFSDMEDLLLFDPIHEVDATGWPSVSTDPQA